MIFPNYLHVPNMSEIRVSAESREKTSKTISGQRDRSMNRSGQRVCPAQEEAFTPSDLRMMIGQNIGTKYLLPIALDIVEHDPFVDATFYKGDLLNVVLLAERECFSPSNLGRIQRIAENIFPKIREMPTDDPVRPRLIRAISHVLPLPLRCPVLFLFDLGQTVLISISVRYVFGKTTGKMRRMLMRCGADRMANFL